MPPKGFVCPAHAWKVESQRELLNVPPVSQFCLMVARCKRYKFAGRMLAAVGRGLGPELRLAAAHFRTEFFIFHWFYKVFSYYRR